MSMLCKPPVYMYIHTHCKFTNLINLPFCFKHLKRGFNAEYDCIDNIVDIYKILKHSERIVKVLIL